MMLSRSINLINFLERKVERLSESELNFTINNLCQCQENGTACKSHGTFTPPLFRCLAAINRKKTKKKVISEHKLATNCSRPSFKCYSELFGDILVLNISLVHRQIDKLTLKLLSCDHKSM